MAREDLVYKVGVDASDAVSGLRKLEGAVKATMRDVGNELDDSATAGDKFAASIDRLSQQMREDFSSAAVAAEELQRALRAAGSTLDTGDAIAELSRMGVSFDEITADADKFATSLKQLDDVRLEGVKELDGVAPGLATKLDDVGKSADSSKSVLANMTGNAAQDLSALAGVSGSAGVAIGQMGEYMLDASNSGDKLADVMKNFGKVAGPIAAIALATQLASDVMARFSDSSQRTTDDVEAWTKAIRGGGDAAEAYADSLAEVGDVTVDVTRTQNALQNVAGEVDSFFRGMVPQWKLFADVVGAADDETKSILPTLTKAGVTADAWTQAVTGGATGVEAMTSVLAKMNVTGGDADAVMTALAQAQENHGKAVQADAEFTAFFGEEAEDTTDEVEKLAQAQADAVKAARDHEVAMTNAAGALVEVGRAMGDIRADAISGVFDEFGKPEADAGKIRDIAGAIAGLPKALDDLEGADLGDVLSGSFKADAFLDQIDGIAGQMRERMAAEFASGNAEGAKDIAEQTIRDIVASLGGKLTGEQVSALLGLDDLEAQVAVALEMSKVEAVRRQLAVLTGVSGETPLTASIALALEAGTITPEAAEILVQAQLGQAGVTIPSTLDTPNTDEALREAGEFVAAGIDVPTHADTAPAEGELDGLRRDIENDTPAEVPVAADTSEGEEDVAGLRTDTERRRATVGIDASTAAAALVILGFLSIPRKANVYVDVPNAQAAFSVINTIASDRVADVRVNPTNLSGADRAIDDVAKDRVANVSVRVIEDSVSRWWRLNGSTLGS